MSWALNIFIAGPVSIHELASELNDDLGANLQQAKNSFGNEYLEDRKNFYLSLVDEHGLENDGSMNFEDFPYELNIWVKTGADPEGARQECYRFGQDTFSRLKNTHRYRLMMTEDVQAKIDSFIPEIC